MDSVKEFISSRNFNESLYLSVPSYRGWRKLNSGHTAALCVVINVSNVVGYCFESDSRVDQLAVPYQC